MTLGIGLQLLNLVLWKCPFQILEILISILLLTKLGVSEVFSLVFLWHSRFSCVEPKAISFAEETDPALRLVESMEIGSFLAINEFLLSIVSSGEFVFNRTFLDETCSTYY